MMRSAAFVLWASLALAVACGSTPPAETAVTAEYEGPIGSDDTQTGERVFQRVCAGCHGPEGTAPDLQNLGHAPGQVRMQVREGSGRMPAIGEDKVTGFELEAMLAYLETLGAVEPVEVTEPSPAEAPPSDESAPTSGGEQMP